MLFSSKLMKISIIVSPGSLTKGTGTFVGRSTKKLPTKLFKLR
jgi:hypothetical protein